MAKVLIEGSPPFFERLLEKLLRALYHERDNNRDNRNRLY